MTHTCVPLAEHYACKTHVLACPGSGPPPGWVWWPYTATWNGHTWSNITSTGHRDAAAPADMTWQEATEKGWLYQGPCDTAPVPEEAKNVDTVSYIHNILMICILGASLGALIAMAVAGVACWQATQDPLYFIGGVLAWVSVASIIVRIMST